MKISLEFVYRTAIDIFLLAATAVTVLQNRTPVHSMCTS